MSHLMNSLIKKSSHQRCSRKKKSVLKFFAKFTGKRLYRSLHYKTASFLKNTSGRLLLNSTIKLSWKAVLAKSLKDKC